MQAPSLPANENERVQALLDTGLLESPQEKRFDRLTRLAQQVLGVPVALISLVGHERQWFKSCHGSDMRGTLRSHSFCGHTILGNDLLEIPDTLQDPRFADNPYVLGEPFIRFYAGVPLSSTEGFRIGTLCVISDQPRQLNAQERAILRDLADCVEAEIHHIDLLRQRQALEMSRKLGDLISCTQSQFIQEDALRQAFDNMLRGLLDLTGSEYGFIGEVLYRADGQPYLKTYAQTDLARNDGVGASYDMHAPQDLEFTNPQSLFGAALRTRAPVIANQPYNDAHSAGLPPDLPPLRSFLGVPVIQGNDMLAMFGLANRPGGYSEKLLGYLQPLITTIGQLVTASRSRRQQQATEMELSRLSRVASETTNGVVITDIQGQVQWVNDGFTRITGYTLNDLLGKKPGAVLQGPETDLQTIAHMHDALASGEGFEVEVLNYHKQGSAYWIRISCSPLRGSLGELQGFMAIESDITQQRRAEQELLQFRYTLDQTLDCVYMFDAETLCFFYANEGALKQVGYTKDELFQMHPYDIKPNLTEAQLRQSFAPLISGEKSALTLDTVHRHKDGHDIPVEAFVQYVHAGITRPHFVAIVRDASERKHIEQKLIEQASYTQTIIDKMVDGLITVDTQGIVQSINPAAQDIFGYCADQIVGHRIARLIPAPHRAQHHEYLARCHALGIDKVLGTKREMQGLRKDGQVFPIKIALSQITHQGQTQFVALINDITEHKKHEAHLRYLATHDPLTGLPNRTLFMERLAHAIQQAQPEAAGFGVLLLDLDNFKVVNDSFGHHQGDALLTELSTRLTQALRPGDTIARLGGDEYAAIVQGVSTDAQLQQAAQRMLQVIGEPLCVSGKEFTPSASIGYCLYASNVKDAATLLRQVDTAMYAAKAAGRGICVAYNAQMDAVSSEHMQILTHLRAAIERGGFELFYQPQVETTTGRIVGAEALLRWNDPELGVISPARFIPVAESSGQILPLGDWVIDRACRQIAQWSAKGIHLPIAINLSIYQFKQEALVEKIQAACARHDCPVHLLELEITESAAMQSPEMTNHQLDGLANAGFTLALDDFGTGYSSLARLGKLPVHKLKIDRSFIIEIPGNPMYESLVRTTISLGHEMGMQLVAEGVETEAQRAFLERNGCATYQGWLFSKAVSAQAFEQLVAAATCERHEAVLED